MATSFSGGGSRREPPTLGKQLVNFITCGSEDNIHGMVHIYISNIEHFTYINTNLQVKN
jgi:hypothetical protein